MTTANANSDTFRVFEDLRPGSVDRAAGILRGVRICGLSSRNNRRYAPAALKAAVPLYEGCNVAIDHNKGGANASYMARFGVLRNVRFVENDGLRGDLYFPPNHQLAGQVCFDAENRAPVGLSHDIDASTSRDRDGRPVIDRIAAVRSVDIVAMPATNKTFFESVERTRDSLSAILDRDLEPVTESATFAALSRLSADSLSRILK